MGSLGKVVFAGSSGVWGWHATETVLRCPQLFAYDHLIKLRFPTSKPLLLGSLVHAGLAQHYRRKQAEQQGTEIDEWATPDEGIDATALTLDHEAFIYVAEAKGIIADYVAHYTLERVEVLGVEEVYETAIDGRRYTQRLDLVVREADGKVYCWDHKNVGRIDAKVMTRYTLSGQFLGMNRLMRQRWGADFGGVKLNLLSAGKFVRELVQPAPHALGQFEASVTHARRLLDGLMDTDPWDFPKALSEQSCVTSYGLCKAFEVCRWGESVATYKEDE